MSPGPGQPFSSDERTSALGKKGALARWAKPRSGEPYTGSFLDFLDAIGRSGPSRATWRAFWRAADGLPLSDPELELYRRHTGRQQAPTVPARECWVPAGRRGGKSENMIARATWRAISRQWKDQLATGEVGTIPLIASDRSQARNSLRYLHGLAQHPIVKPLVARVLTWSVEFTTGAIVQVATASFRSTRGYTMIDVILEEVAFYAVEGSANPDQELVLALRPALLTVPDARLYGISSPYARRGILWATYETHWGHDESDVLVFNADTLSLNPTVDARKIARAFAEDPLAAASEYGSEGLVSFRQDVESFLSRDAIAAVTVPGRRELPPTGQSYVAFTDPSGGSVDAWALAIAHAEGDVAVLDLLRARRPPFSPSDVVAEYAQLLRRYGVSSVTGDHYGGAFPIELFAKFGITYIPSERTKSDIYQEALPVVNAGRCALLDDPTLRTQLVGLERRTARGGKSSIDHAPGGRDDVANAALGALILVGSGAFPGWGIFEWVRRRAAAQGVASALAAGPAPADQPTRTMRHILRHGCAEETT